MRLAIRQLGSEPPDMTASVSRRQVRVSMENIFLWFSDHSTRSKDYE